LATEKTGLPSNHRNVFLGEKKMAQSIAIFQGGERVEIAKFIDHGF
jgi:hypothetical protein